MRQVCTWGLGAVVWLAVAGSASAGVKVSERFGYDPVDATKNLQAALDSGLPEIIVDRQSGPWFTLPLKGRSNQTIVFEDGAEICAKRGAFLSPGASLLTLASVSNVTLRGKGVLRMWHQDYMKPPYKPSEWRHGLSLRSARQVLVEGLSIIDSGGDGVYLGIDGEGRAGAPNRDIILRDVVCDRNHRQGVSVISAANLLMERCVLKNTKGTPPEDGIDFEPNHPGQLIENCVLRDCVSENNAGRGFEMAILQFDATSRPVSIRLENCRSVNDYGAFYYTLGKRDPLVPADDGVVEVVGCRFEKARHRAVSIVRKPLSSGRISFRDCVFDQCCADEPKRPDVSILFQGHEIYPADSVTFTNVKIVQGDMRDWLAPALFDEFRGAPTWVDGDVTVTDAQGKITRVAMNEAWRAARFKSVPGEKVEILPPCPFSTEGVRVVDEAPGEMVAVSPFYTRYSNAYVFYAAQAGEVHFKIAQKVIGRKRGYMDGTLNLRAYGASKTLQACAIPKTAKGEVVTFRVPKAGFYSLSTRGAGSNGSAIIGTDVPLALDTTENMARFVLSSGTLWAHCPQGKRLCLLGLGDGVETFSSEVSSPDGACAQRRAHNLGGFRFTSAPAAAGGLWKLTIGRPSKGVLEDYSLQVRGVPGLFFLSERKYWR